MLNNKPCRIINVLGCGTSSIVYKAEMPVCIGGFTCERVVVLKELYPIGLDIGRKDDKSLDIPEISLIDFGRYTDRFKKACRRQIQFHNYEKTTNVTTDLQDIYEVNNTLYSVMGIVTGNSYDKELHETILSILNVGMCLADCISKYHEMGYLHLDIKPENIFKERLTGENIKIQLFDFDTVSNKKEVLNGEFSYSEGYEAPEVSGSYNGLFDFSDIDKRADIYSIGAVIFEKIMERVPDFSDQRNGKIWDFSSNNYLKDTVPQLQKGIFDLFRKTISRRKEKRYSSADELKEAFEKLINLAAIKVFLKSQRISPCTPRNIYISRKDILSKISKALDEKHILYLHALGGSGKSETAREYAEQYADKYDFIQSVFYSGSLKKTIANLDFVGLKDEDRFAHTDEDIDRLYNYKYGLLGNSDIYKANTLLIIDNYNPTSDEVIQNQEIISRLRDLHIHILFTTRVKPTDISECFDLENMFPEELRALFFRINPTDKDKSERIKLVDEIIKLSYNHTMTVKLVAMQSAEYMKPLEEYRDVLQEKGLNSGFESEIINEKDGRLVVEDSVYNHIRALFKLNDLKPKQKYIMVNACLLPLSGLEAATFSKYIDLAHFESSSSSDFLDPEIKKLVNSGWIEYADTSQRSFTAETKITLHPLICDIVKNELKPELTEDKCRKFYISFLDLIQEWGNNKVKCVDYKQLEENCYNIFRSVNKTFFYRKIIDVINYISTHKENFHIENSTIISENSLVLYFGIHSKYEISKSVSQFSEGAFRGCHYLKDIIIPDGITDISDEAFWGCDSLEKLKIPATVYRIGKQAFYHCTTLFDLSISTGTKKIDANAFRCCSSLEKIIIPNSVTYIGDGAFSSCNSLISITLSNNIKYLNKHLLSNCKLLEQIIIPDNVMYIDNHAFYGCTSLKKITLSKNLLYIGDAVFTGCTSLVNIVIPQNVNHIGLGTFTSCSALRKINIPLKIDSILSGTFMNCTSLKKVSFSMNIHYIGYFAFAGCSSLSEVVIQKENEILDLSQIDIKNENLIIDYMAFCNCPLLPPEITTLEYYNQSPFQIIIPDNTVEIKDKEFRYNKAKKVFLPDSVIRIGSESFFSCSLNQIKLSNNLNYIGNNAFNMCANLTQIDIPDKVAYIGNRAFCHCELLKTIKIPNSVTYIGDEVFEYCRFLNEVILPNTITSIKKGTFGFCESLTRLNIPFGIQVIEDGAFYSCYSLNNVLLPKSITHINKKSFSNCLSLNKIIFPENLKYIGEESFSNCPNLNNVVIPYGTIHIAKMAFFECHSLKNVILPTTITNITESLFSGCFNLPRITIPDSILHIERAAFCECRSLDHMVIPETVLSINEFAFFNCLSLTRITILNPNINLQNLCIGYYEDKNGLYKKSENLTINGYKNSTAERYAKEHGFKFVPLD